MFVRSSQSKIEVESSSIRREKTMSRCRRDYAKLGKRFLGAGSRIYGHVGGLPLYCAQLPSCGKEHATLLISAGIHGDEPAGVEAAIRLIESRPKWTRNLHITIFPCLNPRGYLRNIRTNTQGCDLNRQFRDLHPPPELRAYLRTLNGHRFDLALALHEDYDASGFYLYELCHRGSELGRLIVRQIKSEDILPIHKAPLVEGRRNRGGVIERWPKRYRPEGRKYWPEAFYVFRNHAQHSITTETPSSFPLDIRVRAQLGAIRVACKNLTARR